MPPRAPHLGAPDLKPLGARVPNGRIAGEHAQAFPIHDSSNRESTRCRTADLGADPRAEPAGRWGSTTSRALWGRLSIVDQRGKTKRLRVEVDRRRAHCPWWAGLVDGLAREPDRAGHPMLSTRIRGPKYGIPIRSSCGSELRASGGAKPSAARETERSFGVRLVRDPDGGSGRGRRRQR